MHSISAMLPYKTWRSILWFILTWIVTIGLLIGAGTSYWITGPEGEHAKSQLEI